MSKDLEKRKSIRTKPTQLPSYQELCDILDHEAKWAIPAEKEKIHFGDFSLIVALLKSYDLPTDFFEKKFKFEDFNNEQLVIKTSAMFDALIENILKAQDDPKQQELFNSLYDYLSESDEIEPADIIFVFGSKSTIRVEKAIELYKKGVASKILISGWGPFYELNSEQKAEAHILGEFAISRGIPSKALLLESDSITVPDNVKRSLIMMQKEGIVHSRVILVNSPFGQRRGWAHWNKMAPPNVKFIRCNAEVSPQFSKEGWYKNEVGARVITKEFFGLRMSEILNTS